MNLNQVNNNQEQAATSNVDKAYDPSQTPGALLFNSLTTESQWWNRQEILTGDVVRIDMRQSEFEGKKLFTDDGNPKFELVVTLIDEIGSERYFAFAPYGNMINALKATLKEYNKKPCPLRSLLGLNISVECTGKNGKAYTYSATINGKGTHAPVGVFNEDGKEFK